MKQSSNSISVVIAARNEAKTIASVIKETNKVVEKLTNKFEIIVNDDGSTDQTPKILKDLSRRYKYLKVYHQKKSLGIAGAFEFLYEKAKYSLIFTNAGDGEYSSKELPKMFHKLQEGNDIVVGKRKNKQYKIGRKIVSFFFNYLPKIIFGLDLYDPGSIKLYKKEVLKKTKPQAKSVFNEAERLIRASFLGYKIGYVNIYHYKREGGKGSGIKPALIIESLIDLGKLIYTLKIKRQFLNT